MFKDLLTYKEVHEACVEVFGFGDVMMLRGFGPFKKGERIEALWFSLETGVVTEYINGGSEIGRSCRFRLEAVK